MQLAEELLKVKRPFTPQIVKRVSPAYTSTDPDVVLVDVIVSVMGVPVALGEERFEEIEMVG
jgi:hypothetical protein